jgi:DNA repair protein RadD
MLTEKVETEDEKTKKIKESGIFTHVCYDMTDMEGWKRLIAEGYLCTPVVPSRMPEGNSIVEILPDDKKISISKSTGDYNASEIEAAVDKDPITRAALTQLVELGKERYSWLIFAAGIKHAEHIWRMLNDEFGIPTCIVHSKRTQKQNDDALGWWKSGAVRCAVNMNGLTTGVDHPPCDLIGMLRPTISPGLWVQMLGRGTRPFDGLKDPMDEFFPFQKKNCLVLDFARNTKRLGPINDPKIPKKKGKGGGDLPVKICDACGCYNHTRAVVCDVCGVPFPFQVAIAQTASTEEIITGGMPVVEYFDVWNVIYNRHVKRDKKTGAETSPPMVRVDYMCGAQRFSEFLCFEHNGYAKHRAHQWWRQHHWTDPPATTAEALTHMSEMRKPRRIRVHVNNDPPQVLNHEF